MAQPLRNASAAQGTHRQRHAGVAAKSRLFFVEKTK
jgi:hypothetical protein